METPKFYKGAAIKALFPALVMGVDYSVMVNGGVETVTWLSKTVKEPADKELQAVVIPPPVRELSKLDIRRKLRALGLEDKFTAALGAIPNATSDWNDAVSIRTDDPMFTENVAAFKAALGLNDDQFESLVQTEGQT